MWLYGASGHGKVIKDILEAQGRKVDGFIDDDESVNELSNLPVLHSAEKVDELIISIGINTTRKKVADKLHCKIGEAAIHPSAIISKTVGIGEGSVVMAGAIINADAKIGKHSIVNTGATVDHECLISDYVHISPHTTLCGNVKVGEGTWIGAGTTIIPGIKIGRWSQIGAGSVVVKDIPDGCLAYGNPCRIVKRINEDMLTNVNLGGAISLHSKLSVLYLPNYWRGAA